MKMKKTNWLPIGLAALAVLMLALSACEDPTADGTLPAPTNLRAALNTGSSDLKVTLTWNPVSGASSYAVYQSTDSTWSKYIILTSSTSASTYTTPNYSSDTPLRTNTIYYYKVGAKQYANDSVGKLSESVSVYTGLSGVTSISASALSSSSIKVTWSAVDGASKYRVYRGTSYSSTSMAPVAYIDAPTTEYTDTSLNPSTIYYYRIAAIDSENFEGAISSNYTSATTQATTLPAPTNLRAVAVAISSGTAITLTWTPVSGASYYAVYQSTDSTWSDYIITTSSVTSTTYTTSSLQNNTTYYYKVGAEKTYASNPDGELSESVSVYTGLSGVTSISASALSSSSIKVTWNTLIGASKYRVYRGRNSTNMEPVAYAAVAEYTDTSLLPSSSYYYKITCINSEDIEGTKSIQYGSATTHAAQSSPTPLPAPTNLTATVHERVITLSWDPVPGANTYLIYGAFSENGTYVLIQSINANYGSAYNVSSLSYYGFGPGLTASTVYFFKVSTANGHMSAPVSATTGP